MLSGMTIWYWLTNYVLFPRASLVACSSFFVSQLLYLRLSYHCWGGSRKIVRARETGSWCKIVSLRNVIETIPMNSHQHDCLNMKNKDDTSRQVNTKEEHLEILKWPAWIHWHIELRGLVGVSNTLISSLELFNSHF